MSKLRNPKKNMSTGLPINEPDYILDSAVKFDNGKPRYDLIPFDAMDGVAKVFEFGARKYADRNWEKGMDHGRLAAAAIRHISDYMQGKDFDESTLHHLDHATTNLLMLRALIVRNKGKDTRK